MQVIIHKLCKSKSSKTKFTELHYISDKNHNDCQLGHDTVSIRKKHALILLFGHVQILETQCSYIIIK